MKKQNKILVGIVLGGVVGIVGMIPLILQKLDPILKMDAYLSVFAQWVITGFLISTSNLKLNSALRGLIIAVLVAIPIGVVVG